jgi:hypothetical protein
MALITEYKGVYKMNTIENKIDEISGSLYKSIVPVDSDIKYLTECLQNVKLDGLWLEFGVYTGTSISNISSLTKNLVYGFDSFEGLHEHWDKNNPQWRYSLNGNIPQINWASNIRLIKGYFEETLPKFVEEHRENVAFLHVDSDLYSSAKTIFSNLKDRIIPGTVICFDEFCDYPDYRKHEIKAFAEFLLDTNLNYRCLAYRPTEYARVCFIIEK